MNLKITGKGEAGNITALSIGPRGGLRRAKRTKGGLKVTQGVWHLYKATEGGDYLCATLYVRAEGDWELVGKDAAHFAVVG